MRECGCSVTSGRDKNRARSPWHSDRHRSMHSVLATAGLNVGPARQMRSVVRATLAPEGETQMTLTIVGKVQNHASQLCENIKCICVGASQMVAWVAEYKYKVTGVREAGYGAAFGEGRLFVKVEHSSKSYERPSRGSRKLVSDTTVVEHWRVKRDGSTEGDCLYFQHPFHATFRCGIFSIVNTTATVEVLAKGKHPKDKSWESAKGTSPDPSEKTPVGAIFLDATSNGRRATARKTLEPDPIHCADWGKYMNDLAGGAYHNKESDPVDPGMWRTREGKVSDRDPQGEPGTKDIDDPTGPGGTRVARSALSMSAVATDTSLSPVTDSRPAATPIVSAPPEGARSDLSGPTRRDDPSHAEADDHRGPRV